MADPLESFVFNDFRGGLNTKVSPFELEDNEAQDLLNVTLTQRGALEKRKGKTRFDVSGFPSSVRAEHVRSWYPESSKFLMASIDGDIYSFNGGAGTLRVDGSAGTVWHMEQMQDSSGIEFLWAVNGVDTPRKISPAFVVTNWVLGTPPNPRLTRVWRNRMVTVGVDSYRLFFSDIGDPTVFGALSFVDVKGSEEDKEPITWMEVLGDNLIVFKENSVWSIYAEPPNIALKRVGVPGCESRFQTCVVGDRAYYWARNGVWSTDGTNAPEYESQAIENYIADFHNFSMVSKVRLASSRDRRVFVSLAVNSSSTNNQLLELVTDIDLSQTEGVARSPWLRHDLAVSSMCTFRPSETDVLIAGAADNNRLHTLFTGTDDAGVAISCYWQSSWKALFGEEPLERLRRLNVMMDGVATLEVFTDFDSEPVFSQDLDRPGSEDDFLWDGGLWDGGTWTAAGRAGFMRARPETRGRYHSIRVSNNDQTRGMLILLIEMMVRGSKEVHT
jgi:hypothetical protein